MRRRHRGPCPLSPETVEDRQQAGVFPIKASSDEFDDGDVMPGLASRSEAVAEDESQGSLQHRLVGLLKTSLLVKSEDFMG